MTLSFHSSPLFCFIALCISLGFVPLAFCACLDLDPGDECVNVTDARLQFNPSINSSTNDWTPFSIPVTNDSVVQTFNDQATISFTFQGSSLNLYTFQGPNSLNLTITVDIRQFHVQLSEKRMKEISTSLPPDGSDLSPIDNHTVTVQRGPDNNENSPLNFVAFSFTPPNSNDAIPATPASTLSPIVSSVQSSSPAESLAKSEKLSGGPVAGIVIGTLAGVGLVGTFFLCLRRRKRQSTDVIPEPLVIPPVVARRDRSHFHRIYSNLPHFTAPSSVWPASAVHVSTSIASPLPITRHESLHEKITPFTLPSLPPRVVAPSPPKRMKPRRPRFSSFFVANPSSHSSRSVRSQSLQDPRVRGEHVPTYAVGANSLGAVEPNPWIGVANEKNSRREYEAKHLEEGKQRAVDFEIDPVPPSQPKMSRKQSLRRFFFTTNPNPSSSSGSSTTSSKKAKNARRTAVAEYVRDQIRRKPLPRPQHDTKRIPLPVPSHRPLPLVSIPEQQVQLDAPLPAQTINRAPPSPKNRRYSQTRFVTMNPNPSMQDDTETNSVLSEIPPPRKDKGKGRAF